MVTLCSVLKCREQDSIRCPSRVLAVAHACHSPILMGLHLDISCYYNGFSFGAFGSVLSYLIIKHLVTPSSCPVHGRVGEKTALHELNGIKETTSTPYSNQSEQTLTNCGSRKTSADRNR